MKKLDLGLLFAICALCIALIGVRFFLNNAFMLIVCILASLFLGFIAFRNMLEDIFG